MTTRDELMTKYDKLVSLLENTKSHTSKSNIITDSMQEEIDKIKSIIDKIPFNEEGELER